VSSNLNKTIMLKRANNKKVIAHCLNNYLFIALLLLLLLILTFYSGTVGASTPINKWGYDGVTGPANWGEIGYPLCNTGEQQSPVNIPHDAELKNDGLLFNYKPSIIQAINTGNTVKFDYEWTSYLRAEGKRYNLISIDLHSPSTHAIDNVYYPMEMHLMHRTYYGKKAIVSVFLQDEKIAKVSQSADYNASVDSVFTSLPTTAGKAIHSKQRFNATDLLPADKSYYQYQGSLTIPPCSEAISWFVLKQPITVTSDQLMRFRALYDHNARPVQALNSRYFGNEPLQRKQVAVYAESDHEISLNETSNKKIDHKNSVQDNLNQNNSVHAASPDSATNINNTDSYAVKKQGKAPASLFVSSAQATLPKSEPLSHKTSKHKKAEHDLIEENEDNHLSTVAQVKTYQSTEMRQSTEDLSEPESSHVVSIQAGLAEIDSPVVTAHQNNHDNSQLVNENKLDKTKNEGHVRKAAQHASSKYTASYTGRAYVTATDKSKFKKKTIKKISAAKQIVKQAVNKNGKKTQEVKTQSYI